MQINKLYILLLPIIFLNNCGTRDFFGFQEPEVKLEGERVSILKNISGKDKKAISSSKIIINDPEVNLEWSQSHNSPTHLAKNYKSKSNFSSFKRLISGYAEEAESKILAQPIVKNKAIFFIDAKSIIYSYHLEDRKLIWKKAVTKLNENNHNIGGGLALHNNRVFVNSPYGEVIAFDMQNGKIIWKKNVFGPLRSSPLIYNNKIFSLTLDNRLIVIDPDNGDTLWEHEGVQSTTTIMGSPKVAADDNILIVPYSNGEFYGLNYSNGLVLWKDSFLNIEKAETSNAFTDIDANPVIVNNMVILASSVGKIMALDKRTGNRLWVKDINTTQTPVVHQNSIFIIDSNKEILNIDLKNGNLRWITKIDPILSKDYYNIWYAPVLIDNKLLIVGGDKKLLIVNPINGKIELIKNLPSLPASSPLVAEQKVFLMLRNADIITIE